jgi:hypothetical protein
MLMEKERALKEHGLSLYPKTCNLCCIVGSKTIYLRLNMSLLLCQFGL